MKVFTQNNELYEGKDIENFKDEKNLEDLIVDHPEIIPITCPKFIHHTHRE